MSPGSIVKLVADYDPAFRVQFAARAPPVEELYWRGPVLHDFDGHTWRRTAGVFHLRQRLQYLGTPYRYRVALEPTRDRKSTRLNSSHSPISYAVFCLQK